MGTETFAVSLAAGQTVAAAPQGQAGIRAAVIDILDRGFPADPGADPHGPEAIIRTWARIDDAALHGQIRFVTELLGTIDQLIAAALRADSQPGL